MKTLAWLAPFLLLGCVDAGDDAAPADHPIEPDFTSVVIHNLSCSSSGGCAIDLGTTVNRTCVLSGIQGNLNSTPGQILGAQIYYPGSGSGSAGDLGEYELQIFASPTNPISVQYSCVPSATNRVVAFWESATDPATIAMPGPISTNRRCFLAGVTTQSDAKTFHHYGDSLSFTRDDNYQWYFGGTMTSANGSTLRANVVCLDATVEVKAIIGNNQSSPYTGFLTSDTPGLACGLTSMGGEFEAANQGINLVYNAGAPSYQWGLAAFEQSSISCVR